MCKNFFMYSFFSIIKNLNFALFFFNWLSREQESRKKLLAKKFPRERNVFTVDEFFVLCNRVFLCE